MAIRVTWHGHATLGLEVAGMTLPIDPFLGGNPVADVKPEDALRAVKLIEPEHVIPIHYNTFDLIAQDAEAWADRVRAETSTTPHVLQPGESLTL